MPLSWNEIKDRAIAFSKEYEEDSSEDGEAKTFWDSFFNVFGITRRRVATFEEPIKKSDGKGGFIDLLWKGNLLVEHKSRGKDLKRAFTQAKDYFSGLKGVVRNSVCEALMNLSTAAGVACDERPTRWASRCCILTQRLS